MTTSELFGARLQTVRGNYRVSPWIAPHDDEAPLLRSWQRCFDAGMRDTEQVNFELVSRSWLAELDDMHGALVRQARPETERLAHALAGTGCVVLLFDTRGVVIDRLCHEASTPSTLLTTSRIGINMAERCIGTTAPAIALADGLPYLVGRDAHFFANTRPFFCVAAPIDDPRGQRLAALDITSYDSVPAFDVLSLVVDAAIAVENNLFQPSREHLVLRFHARAEWVGTAMQALLMVDEQGQVCGANRMASRVLCQPRAQLLGRRLDELFDRGAQHLFGRSDHNPSGHLGLVEMNSVNGLRVLARFDGAASPASAATRGAPLPRRIAPPHPALASITPSLRDMECDAIERTIAALGGNLTAAARQLGVSRNTIYRRLDGRRIS